ncbi:PadR family transcriptional regulator [Amycolatopsis balhimycina DSM 5908]|uniref:PadR family transcriptional regulator n=1 Tax=Amycolatopsis balhimycina DSM 5908 TaxID=1081091 RepID=A0A428WG71_AMYBA|nr:PadR family transcriptional regulator [Amycolatopsis balhimycina]RSM42050.1 PadR family transcriptional regulator [Amycolatopsis balhimycina DSM 5908]
MSATRLLVLGVVRMYGRAHGYQVRRELLTWSADKWANVQPGSIYHALKKMTAEGLLDQVDVEPGDAGPDRVAYRVTADGDREFHLLLGTALADPEVGHPELSAAISLMTALPRKRVIGMLNQRLVHLEAEVRRAGLLIEEGSEWGQPAHIAELFGLWAQISAASLDWLRNLITRLEAGEYVMADDPGRAFGEPPPEGTK